MCLTATIPPPPEVEMSSLLVTIDMFHVMQRQSWDPHLRAVVSYIMAITDIDIESGEEEEGNKTQKEQEEELERVKKKQV